MAALVCDLCGGKLIMGAGGVASCEVCGMAHSPERLREKLQGIQGVQSVAQPESTSSSKAVTYLDMATNALRAGNHEEAENYANKAIEISPQLAMAWFCKGTAAGWLTTGANNRFPESIVNWINAWQHSSDEEKPGMSERIMDEAARIATAILQLHCNCFVELRSVENHNDIFNSLEMINNQLLVLKSETDIDVNTDNFKTDLARLLNTCAVTARDNANLAFGPDNSNRDRYSWQVYYTALDNCLKQLDKAYTMSVDEDFCHLISTNYVVIAEEVRDSCSYTFEATPYGGSYVKDYFFTAQAKETRTNTILTWMTRISQHAPEKRKANCARAIKAYHASRERIERIAGREKYWREHPEEKAELKNQIAELEEKKSDLKEMADNHSDRLRINAIDRELGDLRQQLNSLGLFKGKEKKALSANIDTLTQERDNCQSRWSKAYTHLSSQERIINEQLRELREQLSADKGVAPYIPSQRLTPFEEGKPNPTPREIVDFHRAMLPEGLTVEGNGDESLHDYAKELLKQAHALVRMIAIMNGGQPEPEAAPAPDDPNSSKLYRFWIQSKGVDKKVYCQFSSTGLSTPILDAIGYGAQDEITPSTISTYMLAITYALAAICPSFNVDDHLDDLFKISFSLAPKTSYEVDGLRLTFSYTAKLGPVFDIKPL